MTMLGVFEQLFMLAVFEQFFFIESCLNDDVRCV